MSNSASLRGNPRRYSRNGGNRSPRSLGAGTREPANRPGSGKRLTQVNPLFAADDYDFGRLTIRESRSLIANPISRGNTIL